MADSIIEGPTGAGGFALLPRKKDATFFPSSSKKKRKFYEYDAREKTGRDGGGRHSRHKKMLTVGGEAEER